MTAGLLKRIGPDKGGYWKRFMIKETQHIEFKPNFNEDVIETLAAFANTKGGRVLVGVDDKEKPVKNFTIGKESVQNWINTIKTKTQPQVIPDWEIINYDGVEVIGFSVQEYPIKPVACRGKFFKRVNNSIVKIYDNKIEFYNPGCLPEDITVEKLLSGKYKSTPRNKIIAGICKDMHLIEKYGSGIGRIRDYFKKDGLPEPVFENISEGFQVTVYGDEFFNGTETLQEALQEALQETFQEISDETMNLIGLMGERKYSNKELMGLLRLNDVFNFRVLYRTPAIKAGYLAMLYPDNPKHKNQKYFLTEKGKAIKAVIGK